MTKTAAKNRQTIIECTRKDVEMVARRFATTDRAEHAALTAAIAANMQTERDAMTRLQRELGDKRANALVIEAWAEALQAPEPTPALTVRQPRAYAIDADAPGTYRGYVYADHMERYADE